MHVLALALLLAACPICPQCSRVNQDVCACPHVHLQRSPALPAMCAAKGRSRCAWGRAGNLTGCRTGLSLAVVRQGEPLLLFGHLAHALWSHGKEHRSPYTRVCVAYPTAAGGHQVLWPPAWRGGAGG